MNSGKRARLLSMVVTVVGLSSTHAHAAEQEILVGHVAGYTGLVAKQAAEVAAGATVLFQSINERGGIDGRKLRLIAADDQFNPELTVKLVGEMKGKAVALLPMTGSANALALAKDNTLDLPLIGTLPSPEGVRNPVQKNIFHLRASDKEQTEKILEQLLTVGLTNISILVPNSPAGEQAAKNVEAYLAGHDSKLLATGVYRLTGSKSDLQPALSAVEGKPHRAVVLFGPSEHVADLVKELRARGDTAPMYALSYADSKSIVRAAGNGSARGIVISQVLPNPNSKTLPLARALREDFAKYAKTKDEPTHLNFEGYIAARLIVEAIRKSKDPTAEGVRRGLEQLRAYDLGGYVVDFSPTRHQGSSFVELAVIGSNGELVY